MRRKKTKIAILAFAVIAALLSFFPWIAEKGLRSNKDFKTAFIQTDEFSQMSEGINHLFLGPCEVEWNIQPAIIDSITGTKSYNLGYNHSDYAENYLMLQLYLEKNKAPEYLFLFATPESFDSLVANTFNSYRFSLNARTEPYKEVIREMDPSYDLVSRWNVTRYSYYSNFLYYKVVSGWGQRLLNRQRVPHAYGFSQPHNFFSTARKPGTLHNAKEITFEWCGSREKYFRMIADLSRQHNIKLIAYETPVWMNEIERGKNRAAINGKIALLCKELKIPYFRMEDSAFSHNSMNFVSPYIFRKEGSEVVNEQLGYFIKDSLANFTNTVQYFKEKESENHK